MSRRFVENVERENVTGPGCRGFCRRLIDNHKFTSIFPSSISSSYAPDRVQCGEVPRSIAIF
jgi:hypothetical protein